MRTCALIALAVLAGFAACGSSPPRPTEPPRPQEDVQPNRPVLLELVRRPPVGTSWHEVDDYETDAQLARHHTRHQLLEADVTVVAQTAEQETLDLAITKHESTRDGADELGLFAAGTKLHVLRQPGACKVTFADGAPISRDQYMRFTDAFDCNLPASSLEGDDVLFAVGEPHGIGTSWQMAAKPLADVMGGVAEHAIVTLTRVDRVQGRRAYIVDAGLTVRGAEVTFQYAVPVDADLPVLRAQSIMKITRDGAVGTYTTTRTRTPRR